MEPLSIILGVSALTIGGKLLENFSLKEKKDPDVEVLENFFESVNFCNKKEEPEYATVKWVKEHITYKEFGINIPIGCDVNALLRMQYALENLAQNDVEILYTNQNYRVRVYRGKLKSARDYPFKIIDVPDKEHLYITPAMGIDGPIQINLSKINPNILLAGATGSGKSTLVKGIICQLIENYSPEEFNLIYLDNKQGVESNLFRNIKHLTARTRNPKETIDMLLKIKTEMVRRMDLLEKLEVTSIVEYNKKVSHDKKLPFVLAVIDELFSFTLLPPNSNKPEEIYTQKVAYLTMAEIASMCRASGIHLMFCTQRPTSDIIPTNITCNCGIRIGLKTSTEQESRNIIEENGLELIDEEAMGAGIIKAGKMTKFQAFWLTNDKVKEVCSKHRGEPKKAIKNVILDEEPKNKSLDWREIARGM